MLEEHYLLLVHEEIDQNCQVHLHADKAANVQLTLELLVDSILQSCLLTPPAALEGQHAGQVRARELLHLFLQTLDIIAC